MSKRYATSAGGLDHLSQALLEQETLDQDAAYRAAGPQPPTRPAPLPFAA